MTSGVAWPSSHSHVMWRTPGQQAHDGGTEDSGGRAGGRRDARLRHLGLIVGALVSHGSCGFGDLWRWAHGVCCSTFLPSVCPDSCLLWTSVLGLPGWEEAGRGGPRGAGKAGEAWCLCLPVMSPGEEAGLLHAARSPAQAGPQRHGPVFQVASSPGSAPPQCCWLCLMFSWLLA